MKHLILVIVWVAIYLTNSVALADDEVTQAMPDYEAFDKEVLVITAQNQYREIERLKLEIQDLRETLAAGHGITVDDGVAGIPEGSWVIEIETVATKDSSELEAELDRLRGLTSGSLMGAYGGAGGYGGPTATRTQETTRTTRPKTRPTSRSQASDRPSGYGTSMTERMTEARKKRARIQSIQRRIEAAMDVVIITGKIKDTGLPVTITARGVHADEGWALVEGLAYTITGRGTFTDTEGRVELKTTSIYVPD